MHATLGNLLLECVQNSIEAASSLVRITVKVHKNRVIFIISDNGGGISKEQLALIRSKQLCYSAKHKNRKFGLGLQFLLQTAAQTRGRETISSKVNKGTKIKLILNLNHIDCPPISDLNEALLSCLLFEGEYEVIFKIEVSLANRKQKIEFSKSSLTAQFGQLNKISSLSSIKKFLQTIKYE